MEGQNQTIVKHESKTAFKSKFYDQIKYNKIYWCNGENKLVDGANIILLVHVRQNLD